jgi:hypothetical protein
MTETTTKIKTGIGTEVVYGTLMSGAAVITVQIHQDAIGVAPESEIEGIEAVRGYAETGVDLGGGGMTDGTEVARGPGGTDLLLEALRAGDFEVGHGLDLRDARGAAHDSRLIAGTVVGTAVAIAENVRGLTGAPIDETGAGPGLDDNAAGRGTVAAGEQIPTILPGPTHVPRVAAAANDPPIETRIAKTATGTGNETARATDAAVHALDPARRPCRSRHPKTSWKSGSSRKSRSGRRRPRLTWRLRRTPEKRACRSPAWTTGRLVVVREHLRARDRA